MTINYDGLVIEPSLPVIKTLDIETSPHLAWAWGTWQQNIAPAQIVEPSRVLCVGIKTYGKPTVRLYSEWEHGHDGMIEAVFDELCGTDILVTYNGPAFDIKHLQREFDAAGLGRPAPYRNVDMLKVERANFAFASKKLDYVSQAIGVGRKTPHTGFQLWLDVMAGDAKAQKLMAKYCKQDVALTEDVFDAHKQWIKGMPNLGAFFGPNTCPSCGSENLVDTGFHRTNATVYTRFQCHDCGAWSRDTTVRGRTNVRSI